MSFATVVIPHAYASKWLQICITSLKAFRNDLAFDILVMDNSYGHPSIQALTNTSLGEGVRVGLCKDPKQAGHQLALDAAIDLVKTDWFFAMETDARMMKDGWLDWYASFIRDQYVAIVGWNWSIGEHDDRHYISPSGALYQTRILRMLKEECLRNDDLSVCYGWKMDKRINLTIDYSHTAGKLIPEHNWGPFSECRGFGNVYPYSHIYDHWVPEPGNWIYNRCKMQWEVIHLPGALVRNDAGIDKIVPHKYNYVGLSESDPYLIHYWGGTVSHNYEKHQVIGWMVNASQWWLEREDRIWKEVVPADVREYSMANGLVRPLEEDLRLMRSRVAR